MTQQEDLVFFGARDGTQNLIHQQTTENTLETALLLFPESPSQGSLQSEDPTQLLHEKKKPQPVQSPFFIKGYQAV